MQPFFEEYSSNICERHVSEYATDFSVQVKLAQISGTALKIHASGEASANCMKHGVL
jgi:histidinol phosphatase-like PHP family hydrolase